MKKKVNAAEVARLAGVSQSTVSRVFTPNKNKTVSEDLQEKVLSAANTLAYRPNALARGLIMNKTNMIGLIMGDIENSFFASVLENLTEKLREQSYDILFIHTKEGSLKEKEILKVMEYNVAGIIIIDSWLSSDLVKQFFENDIPVVLFYRKIKDSNCHFIGCDNFTAGFKTAKYLFDKGHKKFAYLTGHDDSSTNMERKNGFFTFLEYKKIVPYVEKSGYSYESGFKSGYNLLSSVSVDAIFCADDIMALGTIDAAKKLGLTIPDDLSIIGFDDISMASWCPYSLSTWKVPIDEMINLTIMTLLNEIAGQSKEVVNLELKCKFVERNTVKL